MLKILIFIFFSDFLIRNFTTGDIIYSDPIDENDPCDLYENRTFGTCKKATECINHFELFKKKKINLKICKYQTPTVICCPNDLTERVMEKTTENNSQFKYDVYKDCLLKNYKHSEKFPNYKHFLEALISKKIPLNEENCHSLLLNCTTCSSSDPTYRQAAKECIKLLEWAEPGDFKVVPLIDRPNMVKIGYVMDSQTVFFFFGSILTEKFVLTAAHCESYQGKKVDTVRAGDRFFRSDMDNERAQELKIKSFRIHPGYDEKTHFHDIAIIETEGTFKFNSFVFPACIGSIDAQQTVKHMNQFWTIPVLGPIDSDTYAFLEFGVGKVADINCSVHYEPMLPNGLHESQFCVENRPHEDNIYPQICVSTYGSSLQFMDYHEEIPNDFKKTLISDYYKVFTIIGIRTLSFGQCSEDVPSLFTRVDYYSTWIDSIIKSVGDEAAYPDIDIRFKERSAARLIQTTENSAPT